MLFCNASYLCQKAPPFEHLIRAVPLVGRTAQPLHSNSFLFLDLFADWDRQEWHTFELLQAKLSHHKIHGQSLARKGATEHGELALSQTLAMFDVYSAECWNLPQSSKDENQNTNKKESGPPDTLLCRNTFCCWCPEHDALADIFCCCHVLWCLVPLMLHFQNARIKII